MDKEVDRGWSPYLAGALTGILLIASVWISGKYVGASTTYVRTAGMLEQVFAPERIKSIEYFIKEAPKIDWQWMFVLGIPFGALIAALTSGSFRWKAIPDIWESRFGTNRTRRAAAAFAGGAVAMFGARLADG